MTELHPPHYRKDRLLIGCAELVDLPDWGIFRLRAKVDTGARTSALHVDRIESLPGNRVRFDVVLNRKTGRTVSVEAKVRRRAHVRSTTGEAQTRLCVATLLRLGFVEKEIEITLASRDPMRFRMLLGRGALGADFLIDASRRYAATPHPSGRHPSSAHPPKKHAKEERTHKKKHDDSSRGQP